MATNPSQANLKPCHICGEHHPSVCKFCRRCKIFHNATVGCKPRKTAQPSEALMHRMQQLQHVSAEFDTSRGLDDIQGMYFESSESEVAAAAEATAQGHGGERGEVSGGVEEEEEEEEARDEDVREEGSVNQGTKATSDNDDDNTSNDDPDAWRQRIDLRAVECCEEGVRLATPPFPFHQKWDLQDQARRKRKRAEESGRSAKKKRRASPDYT